MVSSCGERSLLGRFGVTVEDGVTVAYEALDEQAGLFAGPPHEIPSLGEMLRLVAEARDGGVADVTLVTDPVDGHPVEVNIDWLPNAIDDEECYLVSDYAPPAAPGVYADWSRFDLPDPAPDVFGGGTPNAVVAYGDVYVAVGTVAVSCCAEGDLSENRGVVWTSTDGRTWEVHDGIAALENAMLDDLVTDGQRLLAIGRYADPAAVVGEPGYAEPAVWVSTDAIAWTRVTGDRVPSVAHATESGFIGAWIGHALSTGQPFSVFVRSADGVTWTVTKNNWAGGVEDMAVAADGEVVAVGTDVAFWPDQPDTAFAWRSEDGQSWPRPLVVEPGARMSSVAWANGLFVAAGEVAGQYGMRSNTQEDFDGIELEYRPAIWTSVDGRSWIRRYVAGAGERGLEVHAVGDIFAVTGETLAGAASNAIVWLSTDGVAWTRLVDADAFTGMENAVRDVIATSDGLLAVGSRWDPESGHPLPVVWTADR
jgi:hypothetical protein